MTYKSYSYGHVYMFIMCIIIWYNDFNNTILGIIEYVFRRQCRGSYWMRGVRTITILYCILILIQYIIAYMCILYLYGIHFVLFRPCEFKHPPPPPPPCRRVLATDELISKRIIILYYYIIVLLFIEAVTTTTSYIRTFALLNRCVLTTFVCV